MVWLDNIANIPPQLKQEKGNKFYDLLRWQLVKSMKQTYAVKIK